MTPDLREEFESLREQALKRLHESPKGLPLFSIRIFPSFSPPESLSLYFPIHATAVVDPKAPNQKSTPASGENSGLIHQIIWRSDIDSAKLKDPVERLRHSRNLEPTLEFHSWKVASEIVSLVSEKLAKTTLSPFLGKTTICGCDGTSYEFASDQLFFGTSIKWWEHYPTEWRPFTEAILETYDLLIKDRKAFDSIKPN